MIINKQVKVNSGSASLNPNIDSKKRKDGYGNYNTSDIAVLSESRGDQKEIFHEHKNGIDLTIQGALDDFSTAQDPSSLTIEKVLPTPDKTTSEMSCLTSPDLVSLFPDPATQSNTLPLRSSADLIGEELGNDQYMESKDLICIKIESSNMKNSSSFCIPVSSMLEREVEMQAAARANKIGKERWTSSRVFRMWKVQCAIQQRTKQEQIDWRSHKHRIEKFECRREILLRMTPEVSLQNSNSSCSSFSWKPWLTKCIHAYYNNGNLRITNECSGDDILLALEYFGILTASPDDFVFDSCHAYARIQAWSRYFTHRAGLAEPLLEACDEIEAQEFEKDKQSSKSRRKSRPQRRMTLVWVLLREKESFAKDWYEHNVVGDCSSVSMSKSSNEVIRKLVVEETSGLYDLFFEEKKEMGVTNSKCGRTEAELLSKEIPERMRQDFCDHIRQSLPPWALVRFDIDRVVYTAKGEAVKKSDIEYRPVLRIYPNQLFTAATIPQKEEKRCFTNDLKFTGENVGDNVSMFSQLPYNWQKFRNVGDENISSFIASGEKYGSSRKHHNWNKLEKTEIEHHNNDIPSADSCNTEEAITKLNSIATRSLNASGPDENPITVVDMEFGDLRSVTSVLSEPVIGDLKSFRESNASRKKESKLSAGKKSHAGRLPVLVTAKKIVRERTGRTLRKSTFKPKEGLHAPHSFSLSESARSRCEEKQIDTPPKTTRNLDSIPPWNLDQSSVLENQDFITKDDDKSNLSGTDEYLREQFMKNTNVAAEPSIKECDDDNSVTGYRKDPSDHYVSWGQLLANVCEGVIPAPSSNVLSSSPIRHFTLGSNKSFSSTVTSTEDESPTSGENGEVEMILPPTGFVDQARRLGNDLSNQLDELMKIAYNEIDHEARNANDHKSLPPISKEVPNMLSIDTDEDCTLTSCLTSSVMGKTRTPEKFEKFRKMKSIYITDEFTSSLSRTISESNSVGFIRSKKPMGKLPNHLEQNLAREKQQVVPTEREINQYVTTNFLSESTAHEWIGSRHSGEKQISSLTTTSSDINANDYSKESRYSRHENRFYS